MTKAMTHDEFMDIMNQAVGCYIYFRDKSERMHFVADEYCTMAFCSSIDDAFVCCEDEAVAIKDLCSFLFPDKVFHIVEIHPTVEWL